MPDEEGYLLPEDFGVGGYGAIEANLGHKIRSLAGFGRDLEPPNLESDLPWDEDEEEEGEVLSNGFGTGGFRANYVLRGWSC